MDPDELLIFKERKNAAKAGTPIVHKEKRHKTDVLEALREKIEEHERKAEEERLERRAPVRTSAPTPAKSVTGQGAAEANGAGELNIRPLEEGPVQLEVPEEAFLAKEKRETKSEVLARQAAGSLNCVWHPWRKAYAICDFCHRGFCFEDIIEENGRYYCLEDVDTATHEEMSKISNKSVNIGMLASGILLLPLAIFVYYYSPAVAAALSSAGSAGIVGFFVNATYASMFPVVGALLVLLGFAAGVGSLLGSRRAVPVVFTGIAMSVLFLYNYTQLFSAYDLAIGVVSVVGLLLFSYARLIWLPEPSEAITKQEKAITQWANVGRY